MDTIDLRLLFVAGLLVLGGLAVIVGTVLSSLTERLRWHRWPADYTAVRRSDTHAERPGLRAFSLERPSTDRPSTRIDTCQT